MASRSNSAGEFFYQVQTLPDRRVAYDEALPFPVGRVAAAGDVVGIHQSLAVGEKMALLEVELKALEITNMVVVDGMKKPTAQLQDPRASVLKIKGSELQQATLEALLETAGPNAIPRQHEFAEGLSDEAIGPEWAAPAAPNYYFGRAISIYGGTNEIQHNIVAKGVLGL